MDDFGNSLSCYYIRNTHITQGKPGSYEFNWTGYVYFNAPQHVLFINWGYGNKPNDSFF